MDKEIENRNAYGEAFARCYPPERGRRGRRQVLDRIYRMAEMREGLYKDWET